MKEPTLKFEKYIHKTGTTSNICTIQLQYFSPEQTYDLFRKEWIRGYDTPLYYKIGEVNCRDDAHKVLFGSEKNKNIGFVHSMAKSIANTEEHDENDHIIVTFSGYGDCTGITMILNLAVYKTKVDNSKFAVIDDYDLLQKKYNELIS